MQDIMPPIGLLSMPACIPAPRPWLSRTTGR
jgi:hypothetical protein